MIIWIGIGAAVLVGVYNLMGCNRFVSSTILGIDAAPVVIILIMMLILIVLGLFLDWIGIAMLTLPIFLPIVTQLGFDPVWFGILFAVNMQVSFLSPPFGPAAFYLKGVAPPEISLKDIFVSLLPFMVMQLIVLAVMLAYPRRPFGCWSRIVDEDHPSQDLAVPPRWLFLKIETDEGSLAGVTGHRGRAATVEAAVGELADHLIGHDPTASRISGRCSTAAASIGAAPSDVGHRRHRPGALGHQGQGAGRPGP